jgi:hypothetical protein
MAACAASAARSSGVFDPTQPSSHASNAGASSLNVRNQPGPPDRSVRVSGSQAIIRPLDASTASTPMS